MATYRGDFSFGTWTVQGAPTCDFNASSTALTPTTASPNAIMIPLTNALGSEGTGTVLCVSLGDENTKTINEGSYTVSFDLGPVAADRASSPDAYMATLGTIEQNGTTIQVPYLTTFDGYNQRVILTNHGTAAVHYETRFLPESGVTAVSGMHASGMLAPGTTVLRVADMVALSGGTRTAAAIDIVAVPSTITAATTQVNLDDGSTDTVALKLVDFD